ncbi:MAG: aminotransferase class I/II-fold pyridoxal phosphate-dependent enzyme [Deltaproteobacteria bacterium]|nr:aminotransferase class I/II-fold pyridoxal phosphate-dependent enzyme [Deltaproteobacteria bacterium]
MPLYADRNQLIGTENAFKIGPHIAKVEASGSPVIKLNLGEPDFSAPKWVKDEVIRNIQQDNSHYCDPKGILPLREAIAKQISTTRELDVTAERVCVFPGGKPSIGFAQQVYCNPGDEIIYPSPGFPIYESFIRYIGAVPVPLHLEEKENFTIDADQLEKLISPQTKLIILNFPSNPTGGVASREQLEALAQIILDKCDAHTRVYSDEIYENILFDGKAHYSIASVPDMEARTIISSGFSKSFAWTGGRIGYAVLPTVEEADAFKNMNINYFSCIPPYNQAGAREALENPASGPWMADMALTFEKRRDIIVRMLNDIDGVSCQIPGGAFYLFPNISYLCERLGVFKAMQNLPEDVRKNTSPSTLFQMFALYAHKVAVMDRRSFGAIGTENLHFLRLSIAADIESLKEGVRRLSAAGDDVDGFQRFIRLDRETSGSRFIFSW